MIQVALWDSKYLLEQARREDKGKYKILAYYISLLKQSNTKDYAEDLRKLKEILEVE